MGNIVHFSILNYDTKKDLLKIHRVLQEASIAKLYNNIDYELIEYFSRYLYDNYELKRDTYLSEEVNHLKYLTLHPVIFLSKYKNRALNAFDIILYCKIARSYLDYFLDYESSLEYIKTVEELFHNIIN